jgi:hypothetical protein
MVWKEVIEQKKIALPGLGWRGEENGKRNR